jgi:hypothetical protein
MARLDRPTRRRIPERRFGRPGTASSAPTSRSAAGGPPAADRCVPGFAPIVVGGRIAYGEGAIG